MKVKEVIDTIDQLKSQLEKIALSPERKFQDYIDIQNEIYRLEQLEVE